MRKIAREISVSSIEIDPENPRIRAAIERQGISLFPGCAWSTTLGLDARHLGCSLEEARP